MRQFRGLMNDARVTSAFRVIAFDMLWHGKSSPPAGWQDEEYQLTSRDYVPMIVEIADALDLDKPVAMGCSIGGRIVSAFRPTCPGSTGPTCMAAWFAAAWCPAWWRRLHRL